MKNITTIQFKESFDDVFDMIKTEPVTLNENGSSVAVIIAADVYNKLVNHKLASFNEFCDEVGRSAAAKGMNEALLNQMLADNSDEC